MPSVLPALGGLGFHQHGFGRHHVGLSRPQAVLEILFVEPREQVALFDGHSDIHRARNQLSADLEPDIALLPRPDITDRLTIVIDGFGFRDDRADGPDLRRGRGDLAASSQAGEKSSQRK